MPQKFLHRLADENPELQKQIGCMSGIFQIFDRQHLLVGRSNSGNSSRTVSPGQIHDSRKIRSDHGTSSHNLQEKKLSKNFSMESSKTSFSSSSYSSFSSIDCDKSTPKDFSPVKRSIYAERFTKSSSKSKNESDVKQTHYKPKNELTNSPIQFGSQSFDLREAVKESINKNSQGLPVKTLITEEMRHYVSDQKDSPLSNRISKLKDASYRTRTEGKSQISVDLNRSFQMLDKFKSAPEYFLEANASPRKQCPMNSTSNPVSKGSPRFSFDGRESNSFLNSKDGNMSTSKLRECPRLSLDSRVSLLRRLNTFDTKQNSIMDNLDRTIIHGRASKGLDRQQEMTHHKCSSSLVAKLMGVETMPNFDKEQLNLTKTDGGKDYSGLNRQKNGFCISDTSTISQDNACKSFIREPTSPQFRIPDATPRLLEETTPRRHLEMMVGKRVDHMKQQPGYVYREIEARLTELEFKKSNKDLRALKQVIDSIHTKGHSPKMEDGQTSTAPVCSTPSGNYRNARTVDAGYKQITTSTVTSVPKGSNSPRAFESPIVIMKPSTSVTRSELSSNSAIPLEHIRSLRRLRMHDPANKKTSSTSVEMVKDRSPKRSFREQPNSESPSSIAKGRMEHKCSQNTGVSMAQVSRSSVKSLNSIHTRLQKKKIENQDGQNLPVPKLENLQKHSANRYSGSVLPRNRLRQKPAHSQVNAHQFNDTCREAINLSHQADEISVISDSNGSRASQMDWSVELKLPSSQQDISSPSRSTESYSLSSSNYTKFSCGSNQQVSSKPVEISTKQSSPISVLDISVHRDDLPVLPMEGLPNEVGDDDIQTSASDMHDIPSQNLKARYSHKRLEKVDKLIQKLRQLSPEDDDGASKTDHISSLCETKCPDHRFVYETLLASGILMKDLTSKLVTENPIQLCPSSHLINPELFFVLERTKSHWQTTPECIKESTCQLRSDLEKLNRKLLFDLVNELLKQKLKLSGPEAQLSLLHWNLIPKFPSGQCLAKELCDDIERLKARSSSARSCVDATTSISSEDMLQQLEGWTGFCEGLPEIGISIERLIFRDLIENLLDEVLH
ncbi:protein LONGIFOLIA 2-like [Zingiber officinale]|uniref:DUF4378 domain-containing protein n=1 Tax=Zingiber officinale TaxID=94328 RepID=A0A8J5F4P9_ZINOF|nr:protein LONGIFOLIA 2-like [Zingiber officinale]XP_042433972.1 protein LONGIFOLIA 2-like [Zingiber officinale]XP_042433973.1 protein LONGIFOLIA 2-like [Zingiber officinale]KAG6478328.1 hypothetical protein ZIOFF_061764 [Zingiber officinale]